MNNELSYGCFGIQSFFESNPNSARDRVWICATVSSRIHEVVLCGSIIYWMKFFPRSHISLHYESSWTLRARFQAEKLHGFLILIANTAYGMKEFFPCSRSSGGILDVLQNVWGKNYQFTLRVQFFMATVLWNATCKTPPLICTLLSITEWQNEKFAVTWISLHPLCGSDMVQNCRQSFSPNRTLYVVQNEVKFPFKQFLKKVR